MRKLRMGALITSGLLGLVLTPSAWAAGGGNSGDVQLDNVTQSADPGHEMDPHLACQDIVLRGSGLDDAAGTFMLRGSSPSGSQDVDYSGSWSYAQGGDQVIATISVSKLIAQAEASGDAGTAQGFHFRLDLSQDPEKHKTFWVDCPAGPSGGATGGGSGGGSTTGDDTTTSPGAVSAPAVASSGGPVITSIGAVTASRPRRPTTHGHRRLAHPARHHKARRRRVEAVRVVAPPFTG